MDTTTHTAEEIIARLRSDRPVHLDIDGSIHTWTRLPDGYYFQTGRHKPLRIASYNVSGIVARQILNCLDRGAILLPEDQLPADAPKTGLSQSPRQIARRAKRAAARQAYDAAQRQAPEAAPVDTAGKARQARLAELYQEREEYLSRLRNEDMPLTEALALEDTVTAIEEDIIALSGRQEA